MNNKLVIMDEKGKKVTCDILFSFDCEVTGKSYLVYTDNSRDENGNVKVLASIYYPDDNNERLDPIETEFEWKVIEVILNKLQESVHQGKDLNDIYEVVGKEVKLLIEENKKHRIVLNFFSKEEGFLGEAYIEGRKGRFVIGANSLCDIWMKDCPRIDGIELLCEYRDGILMIADISKHLNFINTELMDKKILYSLNNKDTVEIDYEYSIEVEYLSEIDIKERMKKEVNTLDYKSNYIGDLDVEIYAYDKKDPKISNRLLIDNLI